MKNNKLSLMYFNKKLLCKYKPSFAVFAGLKILSFSSPNIIPFLGILYHTKEIYNNVTNSEKDYKFFDAYMPYEEEITHGILKAPIDKKLLFYNVMGFFISAASLSRLFDKNEWYIKNYKNVFGFLLIPEVMFNLSPYFAPLEYSAYDCNTGMPIDRLDLTNLLTRIVAVYEPVRNDECENKVLTETVDIEDSTTILSS